jgi:DNA polymerase-3 subunit delta'
VCRECRLAAQGIHPDVLGLERFVSEADRDKDVKVATVREIRSDAQITPNQAERKVYLIDRPMNVNAQNAMLKLLEEGPPYAAFLILTENTASLLETVRSRCAQLRMGPVSDAEALEWLQKHFPDREEQSLRSAIRAAEGVLGAAAAALEREQTETVSPEAETWLKALSRGSELELMECAARAQTKRLTREDADRLWLSLGQGIRRALLVQEDLEAGTPVERELARSLTKETLLACWELAEEARNRGEFNVSPAHSAGWLAVKLMEANRNGGTALPVKRG